MMASERGSSSATAVDPVCGMTVNWATAKHKFDYAGKTYYFCCAHCLQKFSTDPAAYGERKVKAKAPAILQIGAAKPMGQHAELVQLGMPNPVAPAKTPANRGAHSDRSAYVCPMCPEVKQNGPGACPKCGMALEPEMPTTNTKTEYTCPMHPEVVRSQPGACPICGMALEPRTVAATEQENPELRDM
ncbi:MAG TPA: heavy metal-binding domain-containing protein, partial [Terriglobales bacterium]|nr:heavy metal-binding domain-containing protein [Terriglobales bacterium]